MAELSCDEPPSGGLTRRERWAIASHRFAVPAAGAAAVAAGATMAAGLRAPIGGWAPEILLATGASVLGASLAHRAVQRRRAARLAATSSSEPIPSARWEEGVCARCSGTGLAAAFVDDLAPVAAPLPSMHRRVVSASTTAGDQIWSSWLRTDGERLPVPLVGPVPETAYSPPRPGAFVPFPAREPEPRVSPAPTELAPTRTAPPLLGPFSEEELDRMFPPLLAAAGAPPPPASTILPATPADGRPSVPMEPPGLFDDGAPFAPIDFDLALEAANPIPPHLRSRDRRRAAPPRPAREYARTAIVHSAECASCERTLTELRRWGPCPGCLRPVCNLCLLEAIWSQGRGYCAACLAERGDGPDGEPGVGSSWEIPALEDAS